jgi:hypothetical protein
VSAVECLPAATFGDCEIEGTVWCERGIYSTATAVALNAYIGCDMIFGLAGGFGFLGYSLALHEKAQDTEEKGSEHLDGRGRSFTRRGGRLGTRGLRTISAVTMYDRVRNSGQGGETVALFAPLRLRAGVSDIAGYSEYCRCMLAILAGHKDTGCCSCATGILLNPMPQEW